MRSPMIVLRRVNTDHDWLTWLTTFVAVTIGLSMLISTGGQVQLYSVALVNGEATTIYGTANQEEYVGFLTLYDWLTWSFYWQFPVMSALVAAVALRKRTYRDMLPSLVLAIFAVLTVVDVLIYVFDSRLSVRNVFISVIANFVGAFLLAAFVMGGFFVRDGLIRLDWYQRSFRSVTVVVFLAVGTIGSVFVYYLASLFYELLPVRVEASLDRPVTGAYVTTTSQRRGQSTPYSKLNKFRLVDGIGGESSVYWQNVIGSLTANWKSPEPSEIYDVSISFLENCFDAKKIPKLGEALGLRFSDVRSFSVLFDRGTSSFETITNQVHMYRFRVRAPDPVQFSIAKEDDAEALQLTQFATAATRLEVESLGEPLSYLLSVPLLNVDGAGHNSRLLAPRRLLVRINDDSYVYEFLPPDRLRPEAKIDCRQIDPPRRGERNRVRVRTSGFYLGALVSIRSGRSGDYLKRPRASKIELIDGEGWLSVRNVKPTNLPFDSKGAIRQITFQGNIPHLSVDGVARDAVPSRTFAAVGELQAEFDSVGRLQIKGSADQLYEDGARVNPTRWERMGWQAGSAIVLLILSAVGGLAITVWQTFQRQGRRNWDPTLSRRRS